MPRCSMQFPRMVTQIPRSCGSSSSPCLRTSKTKELEVPQSRRRKFYCPRLALFAAPKLSEGGSTRWSVAEHGTERRGYSKRRTPRAVATTRATDHPAANEPKICGEN